MNNTDFMREALHEAANRRGFCAPNPAVGAVVVKDGQIIARGTHWACGKPHAEVDALQKVKQQAQGAQLYVTLEPCSHTGRTPPCTDFIIEAGISEVYYAVQDPNPRVSGHGAKVLQAAGIKCELLPLSEITWFYQSYRHWLLTGRPWITAKLAMSMNGKIAGPSSGPIQITHRQCQQLTHEQRYHSDAILTTVKTIISDDPQLNVRLFDEITAKPLYVIDRLAQLPLAARVLKTCASITIFHANDAPDANLARLEKVGIKLVEQPFTAQGIDLLAMVSSIGQLGCHDLWVEAGGRLFSAFHQAGLLNRSLIYVAAKWLANDLQSAFTTPIDFTTAKSCHWFVAGSDAVLEVFW